MAQYIRTSSGSLALVVASLTNLPPGASDGALAIARDTATEYYFDAPSATWIAIAGGGGGGSGTVTSVSVVTANGVSGSVASPTTTPTITLTLGTITPSSVAAVGTVTGSNLSGTNTGDVTIGTANGLSLSSQAISLQLADAAHTGALSSSDWSTFNSKQAAGSYITALTGDATASGPGSAAITLATVNGNVGSFGSASNSAAFTVNAKGLITAASAAAIQIAESQVTNLVSDLAGKQPTGNYITALSGDVVAAGPGSASSTIQANVISNSKLAQMAAHTFKGNNTGSTANALDLTATQLTAELNPVVGDSGSGGTKGLVPAPAAGDATAGKFLKADGTFAVPAGTGVTSVALALPAEFSVSGSPVTSSGTLTASWASEAQHSVFAGPSSSSGTPTFRALAASDIPSLSATYLPLAGGTMSGAIDMGSHQINGVADPTLAQDAATKNYVDALVNGLTWKNSCSYATSAALAANTYNNGTSGVGATLTGNSNGALSVDGSTPSVGARILVKNESTAANNGIYTVTTVGSAGAAYVLTRATDFDQSAEISQGDTAYIVSGTVNAGTSWTLGAVGVVIVGTTALSFTQASGPGSIVAGTGLSITGNTISLISPVVIANGGTNSSTPLNNNRVMQSSGGAIVEAAAITAARALISDANGIPTQSSTTAAELGYVSGVTSSIQTQLNAKQSTTLTDAHILVGNISNVATDVAVSGDLSLADTGAFTIQNNVVSNAKLAQMTAHTFKANNTGSTANSSDVAMANLTETGSSIFTVSGTNSVLNAATIQANLTNTHIYVGNGSNFPADVALSGDATLANTGALTLATVNSNTGSFGSSTAIPSFTVNGKGLITAASTNAVIAPAGTLTGTTLASNVVSSSLTSVGTIASGTWQGSVVASTYVGLGRTINAQTGTTYTFVLADGSAAGGNPLVTASNASAQTYTVPPNSSVAFPVGTQIDIAQLGAGKVTLAQGSGVTINSKSGNKSISAQYIGVSLVKTATDTWLLLGDLIA